MREIILRWSRDRGFFVIPGDDLVEKFLGTYKPIPFYCSATTLADPDLFNEDARDHDWPRLDVGTHQERLRRGIVDLEVSGGIENLPAHLRVEVWKAVVRVIDAIDPPQECLHRLETLRR